jgi:hypothetical protein
MPNDGLDRVGIESFVAGNRHSVEPIRHADMLAFVDNLESDLTESTNDPFSRKVGKKHLHCHPNLSGFFASCLFLDHNQVGSDRVFDIVESFL